jgi:NTP pyrophosphatase (non-canonical NTP hydrolase)
MKDTDSYRAMLSAVQAFHDKHDFRNTGGEELTYRVALMAEECADLLILLLGTAIAADFDLNQAFWDKMAKLDTRGSRMVGGRIRVSEFRD